MTPVEKLLSAERAMADAISFYSTLYLCHQRGRELALRIRIATTTITVIEKVIADFKEAEKAVASGQHHLGVVDGEA